MGILTFEYMKPSLTLRFLQALGWGKVAPGALCRQSGGLQGWNSVLQWDANTPNKSNISGRAILVCCSRESVALRSCCHSPHGSSSGASSTVNVRSNYSPAVFLSSNDKVSSPHISAGCWSHAGLHLAWADTDKQTCTRAKRAAAPAGLETLRRIFLKLFVAVTSRKLTVRGVKFNVSINVLWGGNPVTFPAAH